MRRLCGPFLVLVLFVLHGGPLPAQSVSNVQAQQLADGTVEVLYDLLGAPPGGATVSVVFSADGGATYPITPLGSSLSGDVGSGVTEGRYRRIVWRAAAQLPSGTRGTSFRASVFATGPDGRQEVIFELPGAVPLVMVRIPAGTFRMGSPETERGRRPDETSHDVTLTRDYLLGKYEVTQAQWQAVMGTNPSVNFACGGACPVERTSWVDVIGTGGFLPRLNELLGATAFRLPTEAEWERAARGGAPGRFSFGEAIDGDDGCGANAPADPWAWWCGSSGGASRPVGTKGANPFGLFDMHGNVAEWVSDVYAPYPAAPQTDPTGPSTAGDRIARGGDHLEVLSAARSAARLSVAPGTRSRRLGFRLAVTPVRAQSDDFPIALGDGAFAVPVLFVPGFCSESASFGGLAENLQRVAPERFGSVPVLDLYYDGARVRRRSDASQAWPPGAGESGLPRSAMYAIGYFDPSAGSREAGFDRARVKEIPIERLAGQLAAIVAAVRALHGDAPVDVVGHGLGGLVARALVQGLGEARTPAEAWVAGSVRRVVALGTPHAGLSRELLEAPLESLLAVFPASRAVEAGCYATGGTQASQMRGAPLSAFLAALNSRELAPSVRLVAVAMATSTPWFLPDALNDGVVARSSQDVKALEAFRCAPSAVTLTSEGDGPVPHYTALENASTARLVSSALAGPDTASTACQAFAPSVPAPLAVPGLEQPSAAVRALTLSFGPTSPGASPSPSCRATVVARADDGTELARFEVPAQGTRTIVLGLLPAAGWRLELLVGCAASVSAHLDHEPADSFGSASGEAVLPIALDVRSGTAHFTTELSLVNRGTTSALATMRYTPSLGTREGGGEVVEKLAPGAQVVYGNVLEHLRQRGLAVPPSSAGQQGGTLSVSFAAAESAAAVSATARTTSATAAPHPAGAAGLAYAAVPSSSASEGPVSVYGLRENPRDRSNAAVFNPGAEPVTVRMTAHSGDGSGHSVVVREVLDLPKLGWAQVSGVFAGTGIGNGWVTIERTSPAGRFAAYGVVNDNATNDGSFVLPAAGAVAGTRITVPVLVETAAFRSELVLANRGATPAVLTLRYLERLTPALGPGGTTTLTLGPREQLVLPEAVEALRRRGVSIGASGAGSYAGALRVTVSGASLSDVFAGARTASTSPAGGQFGLFTPGVLEGETAAEEASVYGLRSDATSRSNVAVVNAGDDGDGPVDLEIQVFDGDEGGRAAGTPIRLTLSPGEWEQVSGILGPAGVRNGWVRVRRVSGSSRWIAYGVVNDGGAPGARTGDGAYVPMTLPPPGRAPEEVTLTLPGGVPLVMVRVPAGTFRMGSPISERNRWYDETLHTVTVSRDYWLGKYEVTQAQWQAVMGTNPSFSRACGGDCPVEMVSWNEIRGPGGFLEKLNGLLEGPDFRLPTEAEWERAARAGTQTRFSFGDALSGDDYCGMDAEAGSYAWWCANAGGAARPVGKKAANAFGLHDMHGNAWEWVEDWYGSYPATAQSDPTGPAAGTARVQRGGGWGSGLRGARSAFRVADPPDARAFDLGFRLARSP